MNPLSNDHLHRTGILLIDTSILGVTVGLITLDGPPSGTPVLAAEESHHENAGSIATIARLVDRCLVSSDLGPQHIVGIAVSCGPGSFTGIKIGLGFAYGWAAGALHPLQWLDVSALQAAATEIGQGNAGRPCTLFLPATRTHGFAAAHDLNAISCPRLIDVTAADWQGALPESSLSDVFIVGSWPLLERALQEAGIFFQAKPAEEVALLALHGMAALVKKAWPQGFSSVMPEPNYLRLSTAEEQLARRAAASGRSEENP